MIKEINLLKTNKHLRKNQKTMDSRSIFNPNNQDSLKDNQKDKMKNH